MRDERRWERAALYGCIGAAAGTCLSAGLLLLVGPLALVVGAVIGAGAGLVVGLLWNPNGD